MTNESSISDLPTEVQASLSALFANLSEDKAEAIRKSIETALKSEARKAEKLADKAAEDAMLANGVAWAKAVQESAIDAADALGIVVPEKGISRTLKLSRASDGSIMCSVEAPTPRTRVASGTSSGTPGTRNSVTQITGFQSFILPDGKEIKSAAAVVKALAVQSVDTNAGRALAAYARDNRAAANAVKVNINGTLSGLGDAVAAAFPATPVTPPVV